MKLRKEKRQEVRNSRLSQTEFKTSIGHKRNKAGVGGWGIVSFWFGSYRYFSVFHFPCSTGKVFMNSKTDLSSELLMLEAGNC